MKIALSHVVRTVAAFLILFSVSTRGDINTNHFPASYKLVKVGAVPGIPGEFPRYGGITFGPGDETNTIYLTVNALTPEASIYKVNISRGESNQISGFTGESTFVASAPPLAPANTFGAQGGLFWYSDVLFYTSYDENVLGQIIRGSNSPSKRIVINDPELGSVGSGAIVPAGFKGAGSLKLLDFLTGSWYSRSLVPDTNGTFDLDTNLITSVELGVNVTPDGVAFIPAGAPGFTNESILVVDTFGGKILAYETTDNGDPKIANPALPDRSRRELVVGLESPTGATIDALTGDLLFSATDLDGYAIYKVTGFAVPSGGPNPGKAARLTAGQKLSNSIKLLVMGDAGKSYAIESGTTLTNWTQIGVLVLTNSRSEFLDGSAGGTLKFYRTKSL